MNAEHPWPFPVKPEPKPEPPQPAALTHPRGSLGEEIDPCNLPSLGDAWLAWHRTITEAVARLDNREPL